jgi:putrescine---pyruvate transaminase
MAKTAFLHPFAKPTGTDFITIVKGEGSVVWDSTGKSYIDAMASLWYNAVGHGRQEITAAVTAQMNKIAVFNCFDPFTNEPTEALAERIRGLAPVDDARVFFAGSGSEAIDSAMKLARIAHVQAGQPERDIIISRGRGYHGVNYGGTSAQGLPLNQQGFGPLLPGIINVPGDDVEAMANAFLANPGRVAAVITEPVQGAGGVWPPHEGYLQALRKLCDQHGAFLIADEVICGFGRLGEWFGCTYYGVRPDLITFAKQVTSGYIPLGGVIVGAKVRAGLEADPNFILRHGFTYSGHPTATAAGMANLDIIEKEGLLERSSKMGARLGEGLQSLVSDGLLASLRGVGAMWATVMHEGIDSVAVRNKMYELGVIPRALPGILTFCPPFVTTDTQIDHIVDSLATALTAQHA